MPDDKRTWTSFKFKKKEKQEQVFVDNLHNFHSKRKEPKTTKKL